MLSLGLLSQSITFFDMLMYVVMAFGIVLFHAPVVCMLLFVLLSSVLLSVYVSILVLVLMMVLLCVNDVVYLVN